MFLPQSYSKSRGRRPAEPVQPAVREQAIDGVPPPDLPEPAIVRASDDRDDIRPGDRVLMVVDNDLGFGRFLQDVGRERGFKVIATSFGAAALALARERKPDAITLDIHLPDIDGWRVLDRLKHDLGTRHIPVFVVSTEEDHGRSVSLGAAGVLQKPVHTKESLDVIFDTFAHVTTREEHTVLVLGSDAARAEIVAMLQEPKLRVIAAASVQDAMREIEDRPPDVIAVDAAGPEPQLLSTLAGATLLPGVPLVVHSSRPPGRRAQREVRRLSAARVVRTAQSLERCYDDLLLLLHRPVMSLSQHGRSLLEGLYRGVDGLKGRHVLIVDDDIRNIFALTSVLESYGMTVIAAENGKEGIEKLQNTPGVDIVLMDIMMPDMDGFDTMRAIRRIPAFRELPIVAVTAKAMKGDREKCIEAGAWDYLPKPVDTEEMLTAFRTWLHR